ncbi:MAG: DUF2000 domain-containing protein [Anaerolineaceae bacterium]|nr:DUF2000 domain-containing protein [Anaerolineaceae bacterium]
MIIDEELPIGLIANTAAVLALSIGEKIPGIIGEDVHDQEGAIHPGITQIPIPLLKGNKASLRSLRQAVLKAASPDLYYVDFCDAAQKSRTYTEYKEALQRIAPERLSYLGIAICGPNKLVNNLTGSIGLLR